MLSSDITKVFLDAALTGFLGGGGYLITLTRRRFTSRQLADMAEVARDVVRGVEELSTATGWDSAAKRRQAIDRLVAIADHAGLSLTDTEAETYIHSAVRAMRQWDDDLVAPTTPVPPTPTAAVQVSSGTAATAPAASISMSAKAPKANA